MKKTTATFTATAEVASFDNHWHRDAVQQLQLLLLQLQLLLLHCIIIITGLLLNNNEIQRITPSVTNK